MWVIIDVGFCNARSVASIEKRVRAIRGVDSVAVNLLLHSASVTFKPALTSARDIVDAITDLGFPCTLATVNAANTLEMRHAAELDEWWLRLSFCLIFAVPVFAVSMFGPYIDTIDAFYNYHVIGGVSPAALVLLILATPPQFYIGPHIVLVSIVCAVSMFFFFFGPFIASNKEHVFIVLKFESVNGQTPIHPTW